MLKLKPIILIIFLLPIYLFSHILNGKVIRVIDGDTIVILDKQNVQYKIRFSGIDAPELSQPYGHKCKSRLSELIFKKDVVVNYDKLDRYGRYLGIVKVDSLNVNEEMLRNGMAWAYFKYLDSSNFHYKVLMDSAKSKKRGLWEMENPLEPWEFRRK